MEPDLNIYPINGTDFFCKFSLTGPNQEGGERIDFTKSAIVGFEMEENFFEPFVSAKVTVNNPFDFVENSVLTRGDGKDMFSITLRDNNDKRDRKEIELNYDFVIINESNSISKSDRSNNFKSFTLIEKNYAKLNAKIPYGKKYGGGGRGGEAKPVGDIIKEILIEVLEDENIIDTENWEPGTMVIDNFPEYIIPPISFRYTDLIKYLLRIYYFLDGDLPVQGMLTFDRVNRKYQLRPISRLFKQNQKLTQEAFGIGDLTNPGLGRDGNYADVKSNPKSQEVPVNKYTGALHNTNLSTPMVIYSNEFFTNYSVSTSNALLGIEEKELISIQNVKKLWTEQFVNVFQCVGGTPKPFLPLTDEKTELTKPFIMPFKKEHVRNIAMAQMVSNITFFNLQLTIENIGDTNRKAGKFIDIFRLSEDKSDKDSIADKKLLGRWFVTGVRHLFQQDKYYNVISCVKPCVGPDAKEIVKDR